VTGALSPAARRWATLALAVVIAFGAWLSTAPPASAADEDKPAPIAGVNDGEKNNDFQKLRNECQEKLDLGTRDMAHGNALQKALGAPENAVIAGVCNGVGAVAHPADAAATAAEKAASKFWGDPIGKFVKALLEGNAQAMAVLMSLWQKTPFEGADFSASVQGIYNLTYQLQFLLLAVSLMVAGTRMVVARNRGLGEGFEDVGGVMFRFILAGVALPAVVLSLHMATDSVSAQWITSGLEGDPAEKLTAVSALDEKTGLGPALALLLVVWALLGSLAQFVALVIREGLLIVVVGLIPLAAASSALRTGKQSFQSMTGFIVAALLFKPIASLMYVTVFWLASGKENPSVLEAIASMILIGAAGFCLPALVRIVAPAVATTVAGGSAAAIGGAVGGATGAIAGGLQSAAQSVGSSTGGGSSSGGSGSTYSGQYSSANGTVGGGAGTSGGSGAAGAPGGGGSSGAGSSASMPSGASGSTSSKNPSGAASSPGPSAQPSGAVSGSSAGASSAAGVGAAAVGGVAAVAAGGAALVGAGVRATATTEQMIAGALGNYHGQVR